MSNVRRLPRAVNTMPLSPQAASAEHLRMLFLKLHAIMLAEREKNWIRGIENIVAVLGEAEADTSVAAARIAEANHCFRTMNAGNGSFSDFHVWRENFDERLKANQELSKIVESIWREFGKNA